MENKGGLFVGIIILLVGLLAGSWVICGLSTQNTEKPSYTGQVGDIQLSMTLDPAAHQLQMDAAFTWKRGSSDTLFFLLNNKLVVDIIQADGMSGRPAKVASGEILNLWMSRLDHDGGAIEDPDMVALFAVPFQKGAGPEEVNVQMSYKGEIYDDVEVASFSRWEIADETTGLISEKGAFLTPMSGFYPRFPADDDIHHFTSTIHHPEDWEAIAEGKIVKKTDTSVTFDSEHPIDGTYIVAGPYKLASREVDGIEIAMYYYPGGEDLVERYLGATERYLKRYNEQLGQYAFSRFSTVENWFPTGYGMPTYTLLGSQVLRLPFIIYISFGHEICHNWWGNGVYVDYATGNWCEGITVYCADYAYKADESPEAAREYRLDVNSDYTEYIAVGDEEDFPLTEFTSRTTAGTRTIGYGKAMMVFHMVRQRIGDDAFWSALRNVYANMSFQKAEWSDFFDAFSRASGESLDWFKRQWVERTGAPKLEIANVKAEKNGGNYLVTFDLKQVQEGPSYRLDVPVRISFSDGTSSAMILHNAEGSLYHARIPTSSRPTLVEVDPDMQIFRVLDPREASPTLAGFYGSENPVILISDTQPEMIDAYRALAASFNRRGNASVLLESEASPDMLAGKSLLLLGKDVDPELQSSMLNDAEADHGLAFVYASRDQSNLTLVHLNIWADSPDALGMLGRKLPHYGKYGYLVFASGENIGKGRWPVKDSPLQVKL